MRKLSATEQANAIADARHIDGAGRIRARESLGEPHRAPVGFDTLPGYDAIRIQKGLAARLGIAVPFYRMHTARAGVRSEVDGRAVVNFTSYDYLGLNGHSEIVAAVADAAARWGTSVSASRLTSGERPFHRQLEGELAHIYGAEDALAFVSGHGTNVSVISAILERDDLIVHDALAHNSIVLGAESSGAHRRVFPHNDLDALDALLRSVRGQYRKCLIVTEGLFSMDGDGPDLARLVEVKRRHGAWLMIDEAHALGVLGKTGRGLFEQGGVDPRDVDIWMGTLSKTLVSCGGYVAGPAALTEYLRYRADGMVYSVGLSPPAAVAASAALDLMLREPQRVAALQDNGRYFRDTARALGFDVGTSWGFAVTPLILGDSLQTVLLADRLDRCGFACVPVIPPGVPERSARLRFFLSYGHSRDDIDAVLNAAKRELGELRAADLSLAALAARERGGGAAMTVPSRMALVTGASSGIGAAIARQLAEAGWRLTLVGRDAERLDAVRSACAALTADVRAVALDISDRAGFAQLVAEVGPIDLYVSNAGILDGRRDGGEAVEDGTTARRVLDTNLMAAVDCLHDVLPGMRARGSGQIVLVSSLAGLAPLADAPAYSASKAGLIFYGLSLRAALRGSGVGVSVVCPGYVATAMGRRHLGKRPHEVGAAVAAKRILKAAARNRALDGFPFPLYPLARLSLLLPEWLTRTFTRSLRFTVGV